MSAGALLTRSVRLAVLGSVAVFSLLGAPVATAQVAEGGAGAEESERADLFDASVATAIDKGVAALTAALAARPAQQQGFGLEVEYPLGMRALSAYALVESGVSVKSAEITKLFAEMEQLPLTKTYSVSLYVLALDALWRHGSFEEGETRGLKKRLERSVRWLVAARQKGEGIWGYHPVRSKKRNLNEWVDFSITQFAVLALGVGERRGVSVPRTIWEELLKAYEEQAIPTADETRLHCEGPGWWDAREDSKKPDDRLVSFEGSGFELRGEPTGWPYRPRWNLPPWNMHRYSYSMVAAATSSLVVARESLGKKATRSIRARIDRLVVGGMLTLARDWGTLGPSRSDTVWRNYYYTIYSLEKALDLGGVETLGGIDWYRVQARVLITQQRSDGSWGRRVHARDLDREFDTVSSAFALLFLGRATKALRVTPVVPIVTFVHNEDDDNVPTQVYLPSVGGMVNAVEVFGRLQKERTPDLLKIATEVVEAVPPYQRAYLLDLLAQQRNGSGDRVDRFALESVEAITGLAGTTDRERLRGWISNYKILHRWGRRRSEAAIPEIGELLQDAPAPLAIVALTTLERIGSLDGVPLMQRALQSPSKEVRQRAHRALLALTLEPSTPAIDDTPAALSAWWAARWVERGPELRARRQWDRLRVALEQAATPGDRARVRADIVQLGTWVLPKIDALLQRDSFLFDWVLVREALTGEKRGF